MFDNNRLGKDLIKLLGLNISKLHNLGVKRHSLDVKYIGEKTKQTLTEKSMINIATCIHIKYHNEAKQI